MSRGSMALLAGLTLTVLCAVESYVTTVDSYYRTMLQRFAQPCAVRTDVLERHLLEEWRAEVGSETVVESASTGVVDPDTLDACPALPSLAGPTGTP